MRGTKTQSDHTISSVRAELLARTELIGPDLRAALTAMYDNWLAEALGEQASVALMAVGGLGRGETAPYGDLDLVLLHDGSVTAIDSIAERIWYPIWDARIGLDHSVRTPSQAIDIADSDLKATLGMLDARHISGNRELTGSVREQVTARWRRNAPSRLAELQDLSRSRWDARGDAAFLLEPDLKDCRGGLRDWVGLRALASAQLLDLTPAMNEASSSLLDVRGELHRMSGRAVDVIRAQDRDGLAAALGLQDRDALLRKVNLAARTLGYATDSAWRRVAGAHPPQPQSWLRRFSPLESRPRAQRASDSASTRSPLADGVVSQGGQVVLSRDASPAQDPVLQLRVARAAAKHDLPISDHTLRRLASESADMPVPWPVEARSEFVTILGAGQRSVAALEALDQQGLLSRLIPQWEFARCRAQHNPVHKFTVDRHLVEAAVQATVFASEVSRPDLLLTAAFLHDIGKGRPGDHSEVGAELAEDIATRMGYPPREVALLGQVVLHHLLLADTATRRDLDDPSTISGVLTAIDHSSEALELLHYLSIADALATGPAAWSDWKAGLVEQLVGKCRAALRGEPAPEPEPVAPALLALGRAGQPKIVIDGQQVSVIAPDRPSLLSQTAGLLALHSLDVRSADLRSVEGMAINTFVVSPRFGQLPDVELLQSELHRLLSGTLDVAGKLRAKAAKYDQPSGAIRLRWLDEAATSATLLEVRGPDRMGLLHSVTAALEQDNVRVRSARISSLGGFVVDAFYLTTPGEPPSAELPLSPSRQQELHERILRSLEPVAAE